MCDTPSVPVSARVRPRLTLFETAGCATLEPDAVGTLLDRLTLFETAGCATGDVGGEGVAT